MNKRNFRRLLSALLCTALLLTSGLLHVPVSAAEAPVPGTNQETTSTPAEASALTYEKTKAVASQKASSLNLLYGESSVQYALIDNGEIVISGSAGYNDKTKQTKITGSNMYVIASISKVFTTTAVMQLVEAGKIDLDTPVVNYIPEFEMKDYRYTQITPRMLLNHSSGLMGSTLNNAMLFADTDTYNHDRFLEMLKDQRLKADPGAYSVYCNDGFTLAEILVECVSGLSFSEYLSRYINKPLNMNHTYTPQDKFDKKLLAGNYSPGSSKMLPYEAFAAIGAGGIYSSAEDLCRFSQIFTQNVKGVLSADSLAVMEAEEGKKGIWWDTKDNTNLNFGLGWDCVNIYPFNEYGIKTLQKGGDSGQNHGSLLVLPDQNMAVAVLSSGGNSAINQTAAQEIMLSALQEKGVISSIRSDKTFQKPTPQTIPDSLKVMEGYYGSGSAAYHVTMDKGDRMDLNIVGSKTQQTFIYAGNNRFYIEDGSGYLTFMTNPVNKITYIYSTGYNTFPGLGQSASSGYMAQKIDSMKVPEDVQKAWDKRNNKTYVCINEKYSSEIYSIMIPGTPIMVFEEPEGYIFNNLIRNADLAEAFLSIPGTGSRDLNDFKLFTENNKEYLKMSSYLYVSTEKLASLSLKNSFQVTIGKSGNASWYKTGKAAGKKITVSGPKNSTFAVYNSDGMVVNNSYVSGQKTVKLPKDGFIVFAGSRDADFKVKYVK